MGLGSVNESWAGPCRVANCRGSGPGGRRRGHKRFARRLYRRPHATSTWIGSTGNFALPVSDPTQVRTNSCCMPTRSQQRCPAFVVPRNQFRKRRYIPRSGHMARTTEPQKVVKSGSYGWVRQVITGGVYSATNVRIHSLMFVHMEEIRVRHNACKTAKSGQPPEAGRFASDSTSRTKSARPVVPSRLYVCFKSCRTVLAWRPVAVAMS